MRVFPPESARRYTFAAVGGLRGCRHPSRGKETRHAVLCRSRVGASKPVTRSVIFSGWGSCAADRVGGGGGVGDVGVGAGGGEFVGGVGGCGWAVCVGGDVPVQWGVAGFHGWWALLGCQW